MFVCLSAQGPCAAPWARTYRVGVADLFDLPLPITRVAQQGDGPVGAPTGQDQPIVVRCPADRIHWEGQDRLDHNTVTA